MAYSEVFVLMFCIHYGHMCDLIVKAKNSPVEKMYTLFKVLTIFY